MPTRRKPTAKKQDVIEVSPSETKSHADEQTPTKPKHFKKTAQDQIQKSYKKIVETLAEEAQKGSVRHTKMLFDLGGVKEEVEAIKSKRKKSPSLGKLLLQEVETMKRSRAKLPDSKADTI
jgi:uncharacterized membrane-anchored protein YhcB (DUF1043 family)